MSLDLRTRYDIEEGHDDQGKFFNSSRCHRFIFTAFDQMQRHAAARIVAAQFKTNKESMENLAYWISDANKINKYGQ